MCFHVPHQLLVCLPNKCSPVWQVQKLVGRGREREKCNKIYPVLPVKIGARGEKICSVNGLVIYYLWGGGGIFLGGSFLDKVTLPRGHFKRFPESSTEYK